MVIFYEPICVEPGRSPAALCVGPWRCVCPLCRTPVLSVSGGLCVGARRSLRRGPALSVLGPALSVSARRSLCRAPALSVSGGALCVGPWRSLCRSSRRSLLGRAPLRRPFCAGLRRSLAVRLGPQRSPFRRSLCVGTPRHSPAALCVGPRRLSLSVSGPTTFSRFALGPACSSDPRPAQIRMSPVRPHLPHHCSHRVGGLSPTAGDKGNPYACRPTHLISNQDVTAVLIGTGIIPTLAHQFPLICIASARAFV